MNATTFVNVNYEGRCAICYDDIEGSGLAHDSDDGRLHPLHPDCFKECAKRVNDYLMDCPLCKEQINTTSLFSEEEKGTRLEQKRAAEMAALMSERSINVMNSLLFSGIGMGSGVFIAGITANVGTAIGGVFGVPEIAARVVMAVSITFSHVVLGGTSEMSTASLLGVGVGAVTNLGGLTVAAIGLGAMNMMKQYLETDNMPLL